MAELEPRELLPQDMDKLAELVHAATGNQRPGAFYTWKYLKNPAGAAVGRCVDQDDRLIGSVAWMPMRLQIGGESYLGAQAVDAMVAPDARRLGLHTKLSKAAFTQLDPMGVSVSFVFPQPVTLKVLKEKNKWIHLGDIPRWVRIIDAAAIARPIGNLAARWLYTWLMKLLALLHRPAAKTPRLSRASIEDIKTFDARFDELWASANKDLGLTIARDSRYLNWRYGEHPTKDYHCMGVSQVDKLVAFAIVNFVNTDTIPTWELVELVVDPVAMDSGLALLLELGEKARQQGIAQIQTWMLPHHTRYTDLLAAAGFVHLQGRLYPKRLGYTVPLVVRENPNRVLPLSPLHIADWFVSMGDSDLH